MKMMNSSDQNWYLADIVERAEHLDKDNLNPNRRCLTWVNTILGSASSFSEAYDKAIVTANERYQMQYQAVAGNEVQWIVLGISCLRIIEEELKDGSEISWISKGRISAKTSNSMVKSKQQLISEDE
jgi:hypothetical protein